MRLQVALARSGYASRRKCADLIKRGKVMINGKVITKPGFSVDLSKDRITYCGKKIILQKKIYIILNKPRGVITTTKDTRKRKTVLDLIPKSAYRLYHVGRLDKDSSGLLLITNDGEIAYRLTHPKFELKRVYDVAIKGNLKDEDKKRLERGIYLEGRLTSPCKVYTLRKSANMTVLRIELHEGRKRQIRKMFEKVGYPVLSLKRVSFGPLELRGLKPGKYRILNTAEVERLKKEVNYEIR